MPKATSKSGGSFAAVILLIAVGLAAKVSTEEIEVADPAESSAAQQYFDAVAPEDREAFIKYHLDKGLEHRIQNHVSSIPDDFDFLPFQQSPTTTVAPQENADLSSKLSDVDLTFNTDAGRHRGPIRNTDNVAEPENFAINLLNHFEVVTGFRDRDVYNYVRYNTVCTPAGVCLNPGDVGTICCPF
ncbi:uncharacterized protein LOC128736300 [Sabethes cyaneus]|uniref:uncharacterized protein LOC128736300 n=1 Tax=Sabethes cyaneus TaxID=53552 RepID=UPI00237D453F|nr:uncharacterized protein LOC128736300 [Sabethes cyaneus]